MSKGIPPGARLAAPPRPRGMDIYDPGQAIKCEIDGEPVLGVQYVSIELDRDGDHCLMIFTEPTLAIYLRASAAWHSTEGLTSLESHSKGNQD